MNTGRKNRKGEPENQVRWVVPKAGGNPMSRNGKGAPASGKSKGIPALFVILALQAMALLFFIVQKDKTSDPDVPPLAEQVVGSAKGIEAPGPEWASPFEVRVFKSVERIRKAGAGKVVHRGPMPGKAFCRGKCE